MLLNDGAGSFPAAAIIPVDFPPSFVAIGEFTGDTKPDIAAASPTTDSVFVFPGNGLGDFAAPSEYDAGPQPQCVAAGDFNHDGKSDLIIANGTDIVSILLADGLGGFSAPSGFPAGSGPRSIALGDFDRDTNLDVAVVCTLSNNVSVLLGDGAGGFGAAQSVFVGSGPCAVVASDFNRDTKLDLAVARSTGVVSILLGDGNGGFGLPTNFNAGIGPRAIAAGDFNQDGKPDLAVAIVGTSTNIPGFVAVLLGNGLGGFGSPTQFEVGRNPCSVSVGDVNADGLLDLAIANESACNATVLLGNGRGGFGMSRKYAAGRFPKNAALADLNHDGQPDLVVADERDFAILLNTCEPGTVPIVSIAASDFNASESSPNSGTFTVTRVGSTSQPLTITLNFSGTAKNTNDYAGLGRSLTIPAGASSADIAVVPVDDSSAECSESVVATIVADASYVIGSPSSATVTIDDNELPTVKVTVPDGTATESGKTTGTFKVTRKGCTAQPLTVLYSLSGSATHTLDYTNNPAAFSATIPAGSTSRTIKVCPIDDRTRESKETVILNLVPNLSYQVISPSNGTVSITSND
jgi:hypothetical protein